MNEAKMNPRMLILAREARQLSQTALAMELGISQSKLSKLEAGIIDASPEDVAAFVKALRYPPGFFLQIEPPRGLDSSGFHYRKRVTLPATRLKEIDAKLEILCLQIPRLLRNVRIPSHSGFDPIDSTSHDGDVQTIAGMMRKRWSLPSGPIQNLVRVIEQQGGIVVKCRFEISKFDAVSIFAPPAPPLFFVNWLMPAERIRRTLTHEVGHIIMHSGPSVENPEMEAELFATAFLMPAEDIRHQLNAPINLRRLFDLKAIWRVTAQSLICRAADLSLITESQLRSLFVQMSKNGWRKNEPFSFPHENPTVLDDVLALHRQQHGLSLSDLARMVEADEHEFIQQYFPLEGPMRLVS